MARKYTKYTKELLEKIVAESVSAAEVLRKLDKKGAGGNYKSFWLAVDRFDIDTSHFLGQAHNRGKELVAFENLIKTDSIKKRLVKEFGHRCQSCELETWLGKKIPIELDHIDGNNRNNRKENLRLLCPNCHSLTPTWRNKKRD